MRIIGFTFLLLALALTGCAKTGQNTKKAAMFKKPPVSLREENAGVDFQAFVGRLRKAVKAHDVHTLTSMMHHSKSDAHVQLRCAGFCRNRCSRRLEG